jgi:predicted transcriptional regulator
MKRTKEETVKARVFPELKRKVNTLADQVHETESVVVREALNLYFTVHEEWGKSAAIAIRDALNYHFDVREGRLLGIPVRREDSDALT